MFNECVCAREREKEKEAKEIEAQTQSGACVDLTVGTNSMVGTGPVCYELIGARSLLPLTQDRSLSRALSLSLSLSLVSISLLPLIHVRRYPHFETNLGGS
jgi:hypothetical protein